MMIIQIRLPQVWSLSMNECGVCSEMLNVLGMFTWVCMRYWYGLCMPEMCVSVCLVMLCELCVLFVSCCGYDFPYCLDDGIYP